MRSVAEYHDGLRSAIEQLWIWVGNERVEHDRKAQENRIGYATRYNLGAASAYSNVRLYMRKFFAGLIDFNSQGETKDERLQQDVRDGSEG